MRLAKAAKSNFSAKTLRSLYYTMIHPYLLYGITIWENTYKTHQTTKD